MLKYYQEYTINKFIDNKKNYIIWYRQSGKNYTINKFIEYYIKNNSNKNIFFICNKVHYINPTIHRFLNDVNNKIVIKTNSKNINFINNNKLIFSTIDNIDNNKNMLFGYNYDIIIYNDIYNTKNIDTLNNYIRIQKCKCIFSSFYIDYNIIKNIDYNNDFYINILSSKKIDKNILINELNKSKNDIDIFDISFERKEKLKKINDKLYKK